MGGLSQQNPMGGGPMPTFQANLPLNAMAGMGPTPNNNFGTINNQFINLNQNQQSNQMGMGGFQPNQLQAQQDDFFNQFGANNNNNQKKDIFS